MTAQIGDKFTFKGDDYSIVAISTPIGFNFQNYGITPEPICTACWNGYWCEYEISDTGIFLKNLYINSKDDYYPEINGVRPVDDEKEGQKRYQYMGHHLYKNLSIPLEYTGKILVGKGFLREYYIHMGYQRAWAYENLRELIFENGKLMETFDHGEMAKKLRKEIDAQTNNKERANGNVNISMFIEKSYSLNMEDKAWWIK